MRLTIDGNAWNRGFWDGEQGLPLRSCPYASGTTEGLAWSSGYIEGKAARHGYKATRPSSPRGEAAVVTEPSAAPLRVAAPVSVTTAANDDPRQNLRDETPAENRPGQGVNIALRSGGAKFAAD